MTDRQFKPTFAPVPMRAWRDKSLTALHLRVLGAISCHDRLNSNGQGCWASNKRLAEVAGCHEKSIPRAISKLIERGYVRNLEAKPGKQRSRVRFLTIVYTDEDGEMFRPVEKSTPEPAPETPEGNRAVTLKVTELGYPKRTGRNSAEAVGLAIGDLGKTSRPFRPPEPGRAFVPHHLDAQRQARARAALLLGEGDLAKGYRLLNSVPDACSPRGSGST